MARHIIEKKASAMMSAVLAVALIMAMLPLAAPAVAYADDRTITYPNGDTATLHDDGTITGYATLVGNYWSSADRLGRFGVAIMPGGTELPTACYEVYLGNPNHLQYAVPADGTYPFTATPDGGGWFVVIDSSGAPAVPGTPAVPYTQRTYTTSVWAAIGSLKLYKASANPSLTDGNSCYRLEGIQYGVYTDEACTNQVGTLTCDASGATNQLDLAPGAYWVREIAASTEGSGYAIDPNPHFVTVSAGETAVLNLTDMPQNDPGAMVARKLDTETGKAYAQGNAKLEGAEFTIRYYDGYYDTIEAAEVSGTPKKTWTFKTNSLGIALIDDASFVSGDSMYRGTYGAPTIPLGTILIQETKAPTGYLLGDQVISLQQIKPNTSTDVTVAFNEKIEKEQVKRGDLDFVKVAEGSMERLAGVPFSLTSETTGESHTLVTDENGYASTSAAWNKHSAGTNGNDGATEGSYDAERGVWFGRDAEGNAAAVDDDLGALPYDTYTLEELPCSANGAYSLIKVPGITIKRDGVTVPLGTLDDPVKQNISIHTTAYDAADLDKYILADANAAVLDSVQYMNLTAGAEYTLEATLVYVDSGEVVTDAAGDAIKATATFTPEGANGKTQVHIPFDARSSHGRTIVVYEKLFRDGMEVTAHEDRDDVDQQVRVLAPSISTTATDGVDGDKVIEAATDSMVTDRVAYTNLSAGAEYTLKGALMERTMAEDGTTTAVPLADAAGDAIEAEVTFVAQDASGTVDVAFALDATRIGDGAHLVVFERLFSGDAQIAAHEDPEDEGQTVMVSHPKASTTATDGTSGGKVVVADAKATIVDEVRYGSLRAGEAYEVYGILMDKATGLPLDTKAVPKADEDTTGAGIVDEAQMRTASMRALWDELRRATERGTIDQVRIADAMRAHADVAGSLICAHAELTPDAASGAYRMSFDFDASKWVGADEGVDVVVYEAIAREGRIVAAHADLADEGQTVAVSPSSIGTEATDGADRDHSVLPSLEAEIIDTVRYENLIPGREYKVTGKLMDKASGKQLYVDDKAIEQTVTFTPNAPTGIVNVVFTLDTTKLLGKEIVAFETVYKDGIEVAVHADIEDAAQTVIIEDGPKGGTLPQTGGAWKPFAVLGAMACALLAYGTFRHMRRSSGIEPEVASE